MSGLPGEATRPGLSSRVRLLDLLVLTNLVVLAVVTTARYFPRFVRYRGTANLEELFVYAAVLFSATVAVWLRARRHADIDGTTLALLQLGLLLHWVGASVTVGDERLYDTVLAGLVRFDKVVHFANGAITVAVLLRATPLARARLDRAFLLLVTVLTALGLAALVELVELAVLSTIPAAATGGAVDGMRDLLAGLLGSLCVLPILRPRRGR